MTARSDQLIKFIKDFHKTNYRMPTAKEIEFNLNIERKSLKRMTGFLVKEGKLEPLARGMIPFRISG